MGRHRARWLIGAALLGIAGCGLTTPNRTIFFGANCPRFPQASVWISNYDRRYPSASRVWLYRWAYNPAPPVAMLPPVPAPVPSGMELPPDLLPVPSPPPPPPPPAPAAEEPVESVPSVPVPGPTALKENDIRPVRHTVVEEPRTTTADVKSPRGVWLFTR